MSLRRVSVVAACLWASLHFTPAARADDSAQCIEAHRSVQIDRHEHRFLNAKKNLSICSRDACPSLIGKDCRNWSAEIESAIPSVVLDARDERDHQIEGARVVIDGDRLVPNLDGRALEVDPGSHTFRFEAPGMVAKEVRAVVLEGVHAQRVAAVLGAPSVPHSVTGESKIVSSRRIPPLSIAFGVASIVGFGVATGFGISGLSARSDLEASGCRPNCATKDVESIDRRFLVADVGLAVGVTSAVLAVVFYLTQAEASMPARSGSFSPPFAFQY